MIDTGRTPPLATYRRELATVADVAELRADIARLKTGLLWAIVLQTAVLLAAMVGLALLCRPVVAPS